MTSNDKPRRPGAKAPDRDRKPRDGASRPGDKKPAGKKPFGAAARSEGASRGERASAKPAAGKAPFGKPASGKPAAAGRDARSTSGKPEKARAAATPAAVSHGATQEPERISKLLARAGVASRRDVERMIMEGRVSVNGVVLETPVLNATFADVIEVDGMPIRGIERTRLWLYHKPAGLVTTNSDPEGRTTVFERLPEDLPRVMSVGRLDINTEGLLLLTNDGGLARVLELPATGWLRRYRVRAHGKIEQEALDQLKEGIAVEGVLYGGIEATLDKVQGSNVWITMGLREGKNREIKNVLGALGLEVNRLIRISYGPFQLGELPEGHAQEIRGRTLRDQLGPRLIEDAHANFDAPLFDQGQGQDDREETPARPAKPAWGAERAGGDFREKDGDRREKPRGRLDTRRDEGRRDDRSGGGRGDKRDDRRDRDERGFSDHSKREPGNRPRKSNVWMAPGARPVAEKKAKPAEAEDTAKREQRARPEGAPKTKRYGRTWDGEATKTKSRFDPDRKKPGGRPSTGRPGADRGERKVRVLGAEEGGDWIRASEPETRSRDDGDRGFGRGRPGGDGDRGPRAFGDRPQRDDRKPRGAFGGKSFSGERSFGDRPDRDRPDRDRPDRDRPDRDRPDRDGAARDRGPRDRFSSDRNFGDKPSGGKPAGKAFGGKPSFGKPSFGKPSFGKSAGGRPGGKPGGGRPAGAGGRPGGGKPGGGRPAGGKPRGRGN